MKRARIYPIGDEPEQTVELRLTRNGVVAITEDRRMIEPIYQWNIKAWVEEASDDSYEA